jgi:hypothetical protein
MGWFTRELHVAAECLPMGMEAAPSPWRRLGRLLVEDGLITEDQLDAALEQQIRTRRLLGEIVVELGYVSPDDVERALAIQSGVAVGGAPAFGTGLRSELERRATEPVDQPPPPAIELVAAPPEEAPEPEPSEPDLGYVLMAQLPDGYVLVDRQGAPPPAGTVLEVPERGAFRVEAVGRSPYPDDPRQCVFALRVHQSPV